jgi:cupin fold WbuC family metalloprotein
MSADLPNVFHSTDDLTVVGSEWIERLKAVALESPLRRSRLCLHQSEDDTLHEMIIAVARDCLFPPHRHVAKVESYHMIQGRMVLIIFDDHGAPLRAMVLAPPGQGGVICYRLGKPLFHAILPLDDAVMFHEVTNGPFKRGEAILADWAPTAHDELGAFLAQSAAACGIDRRLVGLP